MQNHARKASASFQARRYEEQLPSTLLMMKKPAGAYELVSINAEQKNKNSPEKEYYVRTA